jgi:hypothetical protein
VVDPDCDSSGIESCYTCRDSGSCSRNGDCGDIVPDDNAHCTGEAPAGWTCDPGFYEDDACDCGCGAPDPACAGDGVAACDFCNGTGSCSSAACPGSIHPDDNAVCGG